MSHSRAQELCESRGGRPGHPVSNSLYGGRKAIFEEEEDESVQSLSQPTRQVNAQQFDTDSRK